MKLSRRRKVTLSNPEQLNSSALTLSDDQIWNAYALIASVTWHYATLNAKKYDT